MKNNRDAARNRSTSNVPSRPTNFIRLMLDRLHAVSSRNMYSLQGLLALIAPLTGQVCHLLIVVSYCTPGSPQCQAHSAILLSSSLASYDGAGTSGLSVIQRVCHSPPTRTVSMKSSVRRTDKLAFWKHTLP